MNMYFAYPALKDYITCDPGPFEYERVGNAGYRIRKGVAEMSGALIIPATFNNKPVMHIADNAFANCTGITSVQISDGVIIVGVGAFSGCTSLLSVEMQNSVMEIQDRAFEGCSKLSSIQMSNRLTRIGARGFADCTSLSSIQLPSGMEIIDNNAFEDCTSLVNFNIPSGITKIAEKAFWRCSSLKNVQIPSTVTEIGNYAFDNCKELSNLQIPGSVRSIGNYAFANIDFLWQRMKIPGSVVSIGVGAFSNSKYLSCVQMDNGIRTIGDYAFSGCTKLHMVIIPDSVTSIGEGAFESCVMLMFVCINANMSNSSSTSDILELDDSAFDGCQRLGRIIVPNDDYIYNEYVAEFEAQGFEDMVVRETAGLNFTLLENGTYEVSKGADPLVGEIIIPSMYNGEPVTRIADNGFINCAIEDVIIPSSIETIGENAFANCDNLGMAILLRTAADGITDISATAFNGSDNVCFRVFDEASYYAYYEHFVSVGAADLAQYIQFIMYI
ncbi:MAG: hypothetical protein E7350_00905 [Clostridiales bacterium]|nr:hypothetical protein [Clostridiales bacterium]